MSLNIQPHIESDDPIGVRVVSSPADWVGFAISFRRDDLSKALKFDELATPGVYLLWATNPETKIYAEQSGNVASRLKDHHTNKGFCHSSRSIKYVAKNVPANTITKL